MGNVVPTTLPVEVRAAIDVILECCDAVYSQPDTLIAGPTEIITELRRHANFARYGAPLLACLDRASSIEAAITRLRPTHIITMSDGNLAKLLSPVRVRPLSLGAELPTGFWNTAGYELVRIHGVQGVGSLSWASLERLFRILGQYELADRSRIAMTRTMASSKATVSLTSFVIREYRSRA